MNRVYKTGLQKLGLGHRLKGLKGLQNKNKNTTLIPCHVSHQLIYLIGFNLILRKPI